MKKEETELLDFYKIYQFLSSDVARAMSESDLKHRLFKEQPFVMSMPAFRVWKETDSRETVLVQGIIDVFWEEEDGMVILDYKTDRVDTAEELLRRYQAQLLLYGEAVERMFPEKRIKRILIYSFRLGQMIPVPSL